MIAFIQGILLEKFNLSVIVDVGGLGYEIFVPLTTAYNLPESGNKISLYTYLIIREDSHTLYGFHDKITKELFLMLIKVNGVGPKLALAILSNIEAFEFYNCVEENNIARLIKIPGVGKKTAERLLIEVRDKIKSIAVDSGLISQKPNNNTFKTDAISALVALGYKSFEASRAVDSCIKEANNANSQEIIRQALKILS